MNDTITPLLKTIRKRNENEFDLETCTKVRVSDEIDTCIYYRRCLDFICEAETQQLPYWAKHRERVCPHDKKCPDFVAVPVKKSCP